MLVWDDGHVPARTDRWAKCPKPDIHTLRSPYAGRAWDNRETHEKNPEKVRP